MTSRRPDAKAKLLDAAIAAFRTRGYAATTVDDLCTAAGVTKGAFFHHFDSKEGIGVGAAQHWTAISGDLFESAPYHRHADPVDRLLAYVAFRKDLLKGALPEFTCLAGTLVQETYASSPAIRKACNASIAGHAATLESDIAEAMRRCTSVPEWTARSLALHTQAVIQGAFILAKAGQDRELAVDSIDHLHRYLTMLFVRRRRRRSVSNHRVPRSATRN
jgi:TetR/AcrR family transcriptional repressor of nem operon